MTIRLFTAAALIALYSLVSANAGAAQFVEGPDRMKARAYSPAVITDGGRIVWLAGMGGITETDGKPITDFAGQTRQAFQNIEATSQKGWRDTNRYRDNDCVHSQSGGWRPVRQNPERKSSRADSRQVR